LKYYGKEENVIIEEGIKRLEAYSFKGMKLNKIQLPNSLESIGSQVFDGCNELTNLKLGKNISEFDSMSIYNSAIENITIDENNHNFKIIDGALYNYEGTIFISPIKKLGSITTYEIPKGVKEIANKAFHNQYEMTNIILPDTLEKIGNSFNFCISLTTIEIPSSVTKISNSCFNSCGNNLKQIVIHKPKGTISGSPWGCIYGDKAVEWNN